MEYKGKILATISLKDTRTGVIVLKKNIELPSGDLIKAAERIALALVKRMDVQNGTLQVQNLKKHIPDSNAYRMYLQGKYAQQKRDPVEMKKALLYFRNAIEIDPDFAQAYASKCDNYVLMVENRVIPFFEGVHEARLALDSAILLDSGLAEVQASNALYLTNIEGKRAAALQALAKAVTIDSNYIEAHQWYAVELSCDGGTKEAISHIDFALKSSPLTVRVWEQKLMILIFARKYAEAIRFALSADPELMEKNAFAVQVTECYFQLGKKDSALNFAGMIEDTATSALWLAIIKQDNKKFLEMVSGETKKTEPDNELLAYLYTLLGIKEKAISTLNTALSKYEYNFLKFLKVDPRWDSLRNEPGFQALLLRLGL